MNLGRLLMVRPPHLKEKSVHLRLKLRGHRELLQSAKLGHFCPLGDGLGTMLYRVVPQVIRSLSISRLYTLYKCLLAILRLSLFTVSEHHHLPRRVASSKSWVSTASAGICTQRTTEPRINVDLTAI